MDSKNETIIEQDKVELTEDNLSPMPKQHDSIPYIKIVICAIIAFIVPFICFISPKAKVRKEINNAYCSLQNEEALNFSLSQQSSDSSRVVASMQNAKQSIEKQKTYLTDAEDRKKASRSFTIDGCKFTMIKVNGGTFNMGSNQGKSNEAPVHRVTLSGYYIGETEVTQRLWEKVMGYNPSEYKCPEYPVTNVSWNDCMRFVRILNKKYGLPFSLPTEAQWEYAARGGSKSRGYKYSGSNTHSEVANCVEGSFWGDLLGYSNTPNFVRSQSSNELGIFDMSGNVKEWCYDNGNEYESSAQTDPIDLVVIDPNAPAYRAVRGGGYLSKPGECRSTCRDDMESENSSKVIGFRLVLNE